MLLKHILYFDTVEAAKRAEIALMQTTIDCCDMQVDNAGDFPALTFATTYELNGDARVALETIAESISSEFNIDPLGVPSWERVFGAIPVAIGTEDARRRHRDLWEQIRQRGGQMTEQEEAELNRLFVRAYPMLGSRRIDPVVNFLLDVCGHYLRVRGALWRLAETRVLVGWHDAEGQLPCYLSVREIASFLVHCPFAWLALCGLLSLVWFPLGSALFQLFILGNVVRFLSRRGLV